jgi:cytosine deaminase
MTRVPELMKAGLTVAFGHDCVMDPWYSMGSGDMLEVAHMGVHVGQMTSLDGMRACFAAVTENPAKILGLEGYGLAPGCYADMVVLQAADPIEAIRLKPTRLHVVRRGKVVAETPATVAKLDVAGRPAYVELTRTG